MTTQYTSGGKKGGSIFPPPAVNLQLLSLSYVLPPPRVQYCPATPLKLLMEKGHLHFATLNIQKEKVKRKHLFSLNIWSPFALHYFTKKNLNPSFELKHDSLTRITNGSIFKGK